MAQDCTRIDPIFIVGVGRSGTTLLVNLMGAHPMLAPIYETPFLRKVIRHCETTARAWGSPLARAAPSLVRFFLRTKGAKLVESLLRDAQNLPDPSWLKQEYEKFPFGLGHCIFYSPEDIQRETSLWTKELCQSPMAPQAIYRSAREYVDRLFAVHCAHLRKPFWVNKTPALLNYADRLSRLYPSARYIHMVRDGREVAASLVSLPWGPKTIADAARHWRSHILNGRLRLKESQLLFIEISYKDLVESPETTLERIFAFLEIEADTSRILASLPIYKLQRENWKTSFSLEERMTFNREAGDLLIELGYEKDDSWAR